MWIFQSKVMQHTAQIMLSAATDIKELAEELLQMTAIYTLGDKRVLSKGEQWCRG